MIAKLSNCKTRIGHRLYIEAATRVIMTTTIFSLQRQELVSIMNRPTRSLVSVRFRLRLRNLQTEWA